MSSPLTSLSSLGDLDEITVTHLDPSIPFAPSQPDPDIVTVAQVSFLSHIHQNFVGYSYYS